MIYAGRRRNALLALNDFMRMQIIRRLLSIGFFFIARCGTAARFRQEKRIRRRPDGGDGVTAAHLRILGVDDGFDRHRPKILQRVRIYMPTYGMKARRQRLRRERA